MANTNWANHGEKNTKFQSTTVDVEHCDNMVSLFTTFVNQYEPDGGDEGSGDNSDGDVDGLASSFASKAVVSKPTSGGERKCSECKRTFKTNFKGNAPVC